MSNQPPRQSMPDFAKPVSKFQRQNIKVGVPEISLEDTFAGYIESILYYQDNLSACPYAMPENIIKMIDPGYRVIGIVDVGGEGIIIKVVDELQNLRAIKISLPHNQAIGQMKVHYWKKLSAKGFRKDTKNSFKDRFRGGCILQDRLNKAIIKDSFPLLHVPAIHKVSSTPGLYVDMEWIDSIGILEFLRSRRSFNFAMKMFVKLLKCVEFVHQEGVVHRDLKAENMMIWHNDAIVILDWTLSKDMRVERNLTVNMVGGTHFSPKIAQKGFSDFTIADEVCALGFVLVEFYHSRAVPRCYTLSELKRSRPIELEKKYALYRQKLAEMIKPPLQRIFLKATDPEEKNRYELVIDFRTDLEKAIRNTTMSMPVMSPAVIDEIHDKTILAGISNVEKSYRKTDFVYEDIIDIVSSFQKQICLECGANCKEKLCWKIDKRVVRLLAHLKKEGVL